MNILLFVLALICAVAWAEWVFSRVMFATGRVSMQPHEKNPWSLMRAIGWTLPALLLMVLMSGCASGPQSNESLRADDRAVQQFERTIEQCETNGRTMVVRKTGTRIRRGYSREDLLRAQCGS